MMRHIATALGAVMQQCRMVITPTIWSTAACTIRTATIAMITDHWT
jgi:hypothetical protein